MPTLPLLANPDEYRPCIQDLLADPVARDYWIALFERHIDTLADLPVAGARFCDQSAWPVFRHAYLQGLADLRERPDLRGELNVLELTKYRDEQLGRVGHRDPFSDLKRRENAIALREFAEVIADLDGASVDEPPELLARGLFAGNLFDMGSKAAVDAFAEKDHGFLEARRRVKSRPWPYEGLAGWIDRLGRGSPPYRKALVFVDNAGPDIVLGVIPFARDLARRGVDVVLAANSEPALNDVTAAELPPILERVAEIDPTLADMLGAGRIRVVASGCISPLIDLRDLTAECCEEAAETDLLVLEGMGRAIESNFDAVFNVDTLKVALVKDPMVASVIRVDLFDPIFRFEAVS
ncbi:MAG TPA: ARMT1-like domain-containing protein [Phycisphaerae bacterium]|nr:ARMT1-like domain-containing protein [Phycisphaerae bacterium]HRW51829.1 ARMT1-like domain-containing protein [Phycisphaerae bacterium]